MKFAVIAHSVLGSSVAVLVLLSVVFEYGSATLPTYYCQNGETTVIAGQSQGIIKTLQENEEFYGNNLRCSWHIDAGPNMRIKVTVVRLDLQWSAQYATCYGYDQLEVWEASNSDGEIMTAMCEARSPYQLITNEQNLFMTFSTTQQNFADHRGIELMFEIFPAGNASCPPGWFPSPTNNEDCFTMITQETVDWDTAQLTCTYSKSNLASINNLQEYEAIIAAGVNYTSAWIGLHDQDKDGKMTWVNRDDKQYMRDIKKARYNYYCVTVNFKMGGWEAKHCDQDKHHLICRGKKDGSSKLYLSGNPSEPPEEKSDSPGVFLGVIIAVVVFALLAVVGIFLLFRYQRTGKCPWTRERTPKPSTESTSQQSSTPRELSPLDRTSHTTRTSTDRQLVAPPTYNEALGDPVLQSAKV